MIKLVKRLIVVCLFISVSKATVITDAQVGYSIVLPDNWVREVVSDTSHRFIDTTGTYSSTVGIVRYDFSDDTIFERSEEWTQANFIGYSLVMDADPFSSLLFYDTVTVKQNGTLWATDAYSTTYSTDTQFFDWGEYIRYTASGTFGFELYAIGELDDMTENVEFYRNILDSITITLESPVISPRPAAAPAVYIIKPETPYRLNLLGRRIGHSTRGRASQIVIDGSRHSSILK